MTPRPHRARVGALSFAVSLALVGLPACGEADTASEDTSTTESAPTSAATETTEATASAPTISDVWARTSPSGVDRGAAYMVITGGEADDELTGAAVSTEIAAKTEVHEVVMADSTSWAPADVARLSPRCGFMIMDHGTTGGETRGKAAWPEGALCHPAP